MRRMSAVSPRENQIEMKTGNERGRASQLFHRLSIHSLAVFLFLFSSSSVTYLSLGLLHRDVDMGKAATSICCKRMPYG